MKKKDDILAGMKAYFESKEPEKNMKDILSKFSAGSAKAARAKWESENPTEKTTGQLMSRKGA